MSLELLLWALAPILALQGFHLKFTTPKLPPAAGPNEGDTPGPGEPLRLLVMGESTVAGVGAPDHASAMTGQIAAFLAADTGRAVRWRALGKCGATVQAAHKELLAQVPAEPFDVIVLVFGVNDTLEFVSPERWTSDLTRLIAELREKVGPARVVLSAVPPMEKLPTFPQPLRWVLGRRATTLDEAAQRLAASLERVGYCHRTTEPVKIDYICSDNFHPSLEGYRFWGGLLARSVASYLPA